MIFHKIVLNKNTSNCFKFGFSVCAFNRNKVVQSSNNKTRNVLNDRSVVFIVNFEHFLTTIFY